MKKRKRKLKRKALLAIPIIIIVIGVLAFLTFFFCQKLLSKDIQKHYSKQAITNKQTSLYNKNKKVVGTISKDIPITLEKTKNKYFKIKDTEYYIYYKDINKNKELKQEKQESYYIPFNKNIKTNKKVTFYENNKKILTLTKGVNIPIQYEDENNYYVFFINKVLTVKKQKNIKEINQQNSKETEATQMSILYYPEISENCSDYNCTSIENFKAHINALKENNYYTITEEDLKKYLAGYIHLKEKAIFISTSETKEKIDAWKEELKINLYKIEQIENLSFVSTNTSNTPKKENKIINQYQIKNYTSIESILNMAKGESQKETDPDLTKQKIAVLNYHFFYDPNLGESCNESICLEVSKLREHLQYLKDNNFKTLTMEEFKRWMYGEIELPTKSVLITIDDGAMGTGAHNGNKLIPLLEEYKMNATLFLIAGWWDIGNYSSPYLTIQSHTYDMHQYGPCKQGQINCATLAQAKEDLQKSLNIIGNSDSFCFPFYRYSDTSIRAVQETGFKLAFVGGGRKANRTNNKYLLPRYPISSQITLNDFIRYVN